MTWQPIETAPKDGTEVLLQYMSQSGLKCIVGHYDDADGMWIESSFVYTIPNPSYWMPLPEPPKKKKERVVSDMINVGFELANKKKGIIFKCLGIGVSTEEAEADALNQYKVWLSSRGFRLDLSGNVRPLDEPGDYSELVATYNERGEAVLTTKPLTKPQ